MSRIGNIGISIVVWEEESREEFDMQIPVEKAKLPEEERKLGDNCQKKIKLDGVKFSMNDNEITADYDKNKLKFDQIIDAVKDNAEILDISTEDGDLEDIFIKLTNN